MYNSNISKLVKKVLSETVGPRVIKHGMVDSGNSDKIRRLQIALKIKSPKTGRPLATGRFGDLTSSALRAKVPDLYSGKDDVIDENKYLKIMTRLGGGFSSAPTSDNARQKHITSIFCSLKNGKITSQSRWNGFTWDQYSSSVDPIVSKDEIKKAKETCPTVSLPSPVDKTGNLITSFKFNNLWQNFPKNSSANQIFPVIFPTPYKQFPDSFSNACATRLSLALNNLGVKPPLQFKTENPFTWQGVTYGKGLPITVRAKDTPTYLKNKFGKPSFVGENTMDNVNQHLKGKKGIFTITNVPGWTATGHADIFFNDSNGFTCGHGCHFGAGGTLQAWFVA